VRVKAIIAYDGSSFEGFQRQTRTKNTIQTKIEDTLFSLGINSKIIASGRTDRGVHATGQVIHFDLPLYWQNRDLNSLKHFINRRLDGIYFKSIKEVDDKFHARYSAKRRVYRYIFKDEVSVFERNYISKLSILDFNLLNRALSCFVGEHNFSLFKKSGSITNSDIRVIYRAFAIKRGEFNIIYFCANGFLRSQVRMMVDSASKVANYRLSLDELKSQIDEVKRYNSSLAPANGLYLAKVIY